MTDAMIDEAQERIREVHGVGYVKFMEFRENIWVRDLVTKKRGGGNRLLRWVIDYAKEKGKELYGEANQTSDGMSETRLMRWYKAYGFEPVPMYGCPNALKLRKE